MATLLSSVQERFDNEVKSQKEYKLDDGRNIVLRKKIVHDKITGAEIRSMYDMVDTAKDGYCIRQIYLNSNGNSKKLEYRGYGDKLKLFSQE